MRRISIIAILVFASIYSLAGAGNPTCQSGTALLYFTAQFGELEVTDVGGIAHIGLPSFDALADYYGIYSVEKVFPVEKKPSSPDRVDLTRWYYLYFPAEIDPAEVVKAFSGEPFVEAVECDWYNYPDYIPNDLMYESCWFLEQVRADSAWDISRGTHLVSVSIVDSGIDTGHVELKDKFWINFGEDVNHDSIIDLWDYNGVDDDQNGYIDDFNGWDFVNNDNIPQPAIGEYHGTLCASCAAAATDNEEGVASTGFNTRLMNIRCTMVNSVLANGINYSANNHADIISASWGSIASTSIIQQAVQHAHEEGSMFVTSAGNDDNWTPPWTAYPSLYEHVVSVGATNQSDQLAYFSNYSITPWDGIIDVCAPGVSILSADLGGGYQTWQGTSASSPITAGVCALIMHIAPELTPAEVETVLVHGCDDIYPQNPGFQYGILGHGRINAFNSLLEIAYYTSLESYIVEDDGNNDGRADPGENIELVVTLYNDSRAQPAMNVDAELLCDDEAVDINSPTASFGSILNGFSSSNSSEPFEFYINPTDPHFADFTLMVTDGEGLTQQIDFQIELSRPPILLVDDDGGDFFEEYYQTSFELLDTFIDIWDETTETIDAAELNRYESILWETGNETSTLNQNERNALANFLDNGGNLLISSKNAGADIGGESFYSDYLHAVFLADTVSGTVKMYGIGGCPFSSGEDTLFFIGGTGAGNYQSMDAIAPIGSAGEAYRYAIANDVGGIYYDGSYKLIYLGFPLESVTGLINTVPREEVIQSILDWFGTPGAAFNRSYAEPKEYALHPAHPNPFNPSTTIRFDLPEAGSVSLLVYDVNGREIARLAEGYYTIGTHQVVFDGSDLASGIFFLRLSAGDFRQTQKLVLVK